MYEKACPYMVISMHISMDKYLIVC